MPTWPNTCFLASATKAFPGPAIMSTGWIVSVPYAIAPIACAPPIRKISSAPARCIAAMVVRGIVPGSPPGMGAVAPMMWSQPATLAVRMDMWALAIIGNLPPGT